MTACERIRIKRAEAEYAKLLQLHHLRHAVYKAVTNQSVRDWHVVEGTGEVVANIVTEDGRQYKLSLTQVGMGL